MDHSHNIVHWFTSKKRFFSILSRRGSISSANPSNGGGQPGGQTSSTLAEAGTAEELQNLEAAAASDAPAGAAAAVQTAAADDAVPKAAVAQRPLAARIRENSWFGKKCVKIFKIFTNTFAMTFLAEWGDR
jgi:hypothetical protein